MTVFADTFFLLFGLRWLVLFVFRFALIAVLVDHSRRLAGGIAARLQAIGAGHLTPSTLGPSSLVVTACFFTLLLDGAGLHAGCFALLQGQRSGAGVGFGIALGPRSLGVAALRILRLLSSGGGVGFGLCFLLFEFLEGDRRGGG